MHPKISFILPVFKPNYLADTINSLLNQTLRDIEVVIVHDNPNWKINEGLLEKDKRIKLIINKDNMGIANSYNIAVENSTGDIICPMNDDDIALLQRAEFTHKMFLANPDCGLCYGAQLVSGINGIPQYYWNFGVFDPKRMMNQNIIPHCGCGYRRSITDKIKYNPRYPIANDYGFFLECMKQGIGIKNTSVPFFIHRIHDSNAGRGIPERLDDRKLLHADYGIDETIKYDKVFVL